MTPALQQAAKEYAVRIIPEDHKGNCDSTTWEEMRQRFAIIWNAGATSPQARDYWESQGWTKCEDELPPCYYPNELGKKKVNWVMGTDGKNRFVCVYTKGHELEYGDDDPSGDDYDEIEERHGCLYLKPGWYELEDTPGGEFDETWVRRIPTHWRPLPSLPGSTTTASKEAVYREALEKILKQYHSWEDELAAPIMVQTAHEALKQ